MFKHPISTAFDTYTVVKQIGEGGSGAVYQARNLAGDIVALKCLKSNLAASKRKRFKNEVLFGQRHHHANVISVIDSGAVSDGKNTISFYVMPYYPKTLRALMKRGIPANGVLRLFSQILDGVEAAHLLGVNHRDLKPENILYDEQANALIVADFGAAEFTEDELYTVIETKQGERVANFQYAAPEQRSHGGSVGHLADIFALGLILNEMFTGEVPSGTNPRLIAEVSPEHAYLDDLVELMRRQVPEDRPRSINDLKRQIAGRASDAVAFQRLNALKNEVVPAASAEIPPEVKVVSLDYVTSGQEVHFSGPHLVFVLEPKPSGDWTHLFNNLGRHGNITSLLGRGPETVGFTNGKAIIRANEHEVANVVQNFKQWVGRANELLPDILEKAARRRDGEERERIRKAVEAEEARMNVLRLARKALG